MPASNHQPMNRIPLHSTHIPTLGGDVALDAVVRAHDRSGESTDRGLYVAVAHTVDTARLLAVAVTRTDLVQQLVGHIDGRGFHEHWPEDADHVRMSLRRGAHDRAVADYFRTLGRRWDEEWLITLRLDRIGQLPSSLRSA